MCVCVCVCVCVSVCVCYALCVCLCACICALAGFHKHKVGPCLRDNLNTRASMLISAFLYVQLGALRQQLQLCDSTLALNWPMLRVVRRTRQKKHAARPRLRDSLITFASKVIFARLNMQMGAIRERQQQRDRTFAQMSTHIRGGRYNTQIAKSESQRTLTLATKPIAGFHPTGSPSERSA